MERDLSGRCGTCGFFIAIRTDEDGAQVGECRLGCWPPPLKDTATCAHHKPKGASFSGALRRKKAAGTPRALRDDDVPPPPVKKPLPREIDIDMDIDEFRRVLREVIHEELGVGDVQLGDRWRGGELVLKPGKEGTQEKSVPIDAFFKKIVGLRDKLRVLEQKVNANKSLTEDEKVQLQQYITGCYGSLTTFNVLFRDRDDYFVGQSSK
ncbi:MAG TPA: hypothetical protein RMH99_23600 [Sandaracinaceae bacterium LLY-WYZ-13_1]|nr:hypothetical protein [Sandaracinaceae bacterium LLY-WYZ-13_1]